MEHTAVLPRLAALARDPMADQVATATHSDSPPDEHTPTLPSSVLLRGRKTVQIEHNGSLYQLRATKYGKLILTK